MRVDDPIFQVGCTDARSIVTTGPFCIFANPNGVYVSDGSYKPEDLTASCGLKRYWQNLFPGYVAAQIGGTSWTISAGLIRKQYVVSIIDASGTLIDTLMFDPERRTAVRLNLRATMFARATGVGEELYFGSRTATRVNSLSSIFTPSATYKNDGDGTAVTPIVESRFTEFRPGKERWPRLYYGYDLRDAASDNPILTVSYGSGSPSTSNLQTTYTTLGTLSETTDYQRSRHAFGKKLDGLAWKITQTNASSVTRLFSVEGEVRGLEPSRLN
jgi:hypothetical protein